MVNQICLKPFNVCWPCRFDTLRFKPLSVCSLNSFPCRKMPRQNASNPYKCWTTPFEWKFQCRVKILIRLLNQIRGTFCLLLHANPYPKLLFAFPLHKMSAWQSIWISINCQRALQRNCNKNNLAQYLHILILQIMSKLILILLWNFLRRFHVKFSFQISTFDNLSFPSRSTTFLWRNA